MLKEKAVITCFLESDGEIFILRRSERVGSYRGRWAGVSGYVEKTPDEQVPVEIGEETGLGADDFSILKKGEPLTVDDEQLGIRWIVHPYLCHVNDRGKIRTDWEHREARWIKPEEINGYQTVPKLREALARVLPQTKNA